jgi:hypothetical protein
MLSERSSRRITTSSAQAEQAYVRFVAAWSERPNIIRLRKPALNPSDIVCTGPPRPLVVAALLSLFRLPLSQSDTRATTVLVDELDAGAFESAPNYLKGRATRLTYPRFKLVHGHDTHARVPSEFLLAPSKQPSGCPTLAWRDHRAKCQK